jgi:hypothetical protein
MHLDGYSERLKLQERFIMSENVIEVLDDIGFEVDEKALLAELRVAEGSKDAEAVRELVETVRPIAKPKAVYKVSYVEGIDGDEVSIDGVVFTSRVLSANLSKVGRVFAYVGTCGREFDEVEIAPDDLLKGYWLDTIKGMALHVVMEYLYSHIRGKFLLETTATMSPGEAERDIWPIGQQKPLFSLFGDTEELVGVRLTESMLMIPNKSLSGICFPSEISFKSCQVCQRKDCHARRAAFDKGLMESYRGDVKRD